MGIEPGAAGEAIPGKRWLSARKVSGRMRDKGLARTALYLVFAAALAVVPAAARAQAADGTITGIVKAQTRPVAHARISVRNTATGQTRALTARADGTYTASGLAAGTYEVTASADGFQQATARVKLADGATETRNLNLPSAQQSDQPAQQGGAETVSAKSMGQLPLNGRSASDVAALEPGVVKARTQAASDGPFGFGKELVIYGGRPRATGFFLDGISVSDYANGPLGNAIGISLGVDALRQMSVVTSNDEAEYGRTNGGTITSATRSGTNDFHGSVFYYFRNSALDAANYFDLVKPPFHRSQYGAAIGGPIWRNHTYIFGDFEAIRQSQGLTHVNTVPSAAARAGELCSNPNGTCTTSMVTVDPTVKAYIDAFYPLPNAGLLGNGDTGVYITGGQKVTPGNHFVVRLDHKLTPADSLDGVYMFDSGSVTAPDSMNEVLSEFDSRAQFFTAGYTHTFNSRMINSLHFGIYRMVENSGKTLPGSNSLASDTSYGLAPGLNAPRIDVSGMTGFHGGLGALGITHFRWTSIQLRDDFSVIRGNHSLKFGVDLERMRDNILGISDPAGRVGFSSLADFLANQPSTFAATIVGSGVPEKGLRQTMFSIYAQDDWRLRHNFNLDLGLRYEMTTVPSEVHGYLSSIHSLTAPAPEIGPLISNPTLRNFEPRVGFAWDPFGTGKTIISSGFGIFDVEPLPYVFQFAEMFSAPFVQAVALSDLPQGSFSNGPNGAYELAANSPDAKRIDYYQPNPKRNYVMQWNFTVQRQLPLGVQMKIGYVGSRGVHNVTRVQDVNIVMPTSTPQGYLWPSPAGSGTRLNPNFGRIDGVFWNGDSHYNAMVLQLRKQIGISAQIAGSYTWGKSIDDSSASIAAKEYNNAISTPLWFALQTNRGLSDFNVAQDLKIIYSWQLPGPKPTFAPARWALDGWQIGGVFEASTGVPFTPVIAGDPLGMKSTDINQDVPNVLSGPGCSSLVNPGNPTQYIRTQCFAMPNPSTLRGNLGRNSLIGPGFANLDFSVFKNNRIRRISDTFNVQFRVEIFNILNRPNFQAPIANKNVFNASGQPEGSAGLIDKTQGSSRQIQLALKFNW